jgi:DNA-binding NarL/FixJ family response regulator
MSRARAGDQFEIDLDGDALVVISVPVASNPTSLDMLTRSERSVALDAVTGLSNAAIARKRRRAPRTIANQLASIYRKLGISSRAELARLVGE